MNYGYFYLHIINKSITNILGSIDKKIEINKKKIEKLEALARDIYDYWFVQYDFPDENGKPYKSSGGELVWNEELKRNIPVGWSIHNLNDCILKISTGLNPRDNFILNDVGKNKYITVKNLALNGTINFSGCDCISDDAMAIIQRRSDLHKGDILFASIEPLGRAHYIIETPSDWNINESVFSIRANRTIMSSCFLYLYLRATSTIKKMEQSSFGSIFKGIRISVLNDMKLILPPKDLLNKFDETIFSLLNQQHNIDKELQLLSNLKNIILPLLMNGQIKVL